MRECNCETPQGTSDRQMYKHERCSDKIDYLGMVITDLIMFVAKVEGSGSGKVSPSKEDRSLANFLDDCPNKVNSMASTLQECIKRLEKALYG